MKNILIINGHPKANSLSASLSESYRTGASKAGHHTEILDLRSLCFDLNLKSSRSSRMGIEPDIVKAQELIKQADHIAFVYPIWWGTYPALLKGFIDRTFLSGFAYKHHESTKKLVKLLKRKNARLIVTLDTPKWFYALFQKNLGISAIKQGLLQYCGISKVKTTVFSPVRNSSQKEREVWLSKVEEQGSKIK